MQKEIKLNDLFRYRSVWMGFAIIWIIFYHSELNVENRLLWMFKNVGYCGVDIFFFASGVGCYYSYSKTPDAWAFLKKRIFRIIPSYWIFLTVLYLIQWKLGILRPQYILSNFLCTEYFLDTQLDTSFNWYMGAIWVMYLLVPFFWHLIRSKGDRSIWILIVLLIISTGFWHSDHLILTATRVPVFFLGMYYEYLAMKETVLTKKMVLGNLAAFAAGFMVLVPMRLLITDNTIMWGCGFLFYPFLLMTPFMCVALSFLSLTENRLMNIIISLLKRAGDYSFELYLVHHLVFEAGYYLLLKTSFFMSGIYWLLLYLCVLPAAFLLRRITASVCSLLKGRI